MAWLTALLARFWQPIAAVLGAIGIYIAGRQSGRAQAVEKAMKDNINRQEAGRDAVGDIRGADRDDLAQRLRDNDGRW